MGGKLSHNTDHVQEDFDPTNDSNDNGVDDVALGKEMDESLDRAPANLEDN